MRFRGEKDLPRLDEKVNTKDFVVFIFRFHDFYGSRYSWREIFQQIQDVQTDDTIESCVAQMGSLTSSNAC